jgi:hypothetical protein
MSQNLATNPIRQMPQVTGPDLLHMKTIDKLVANSLDQTTYTLAKPQLLWTKLTGLAVLGRHGKLKSLKLKKFRLEWFRKIRPVSQKQPGVASGQFPKHVNVMYVGGGKVKRLNHTDGVDLHMKLETIKGLIAKLFAVTGYALKEFRAFGSGESANRDREAVQHDNGISESFGYVFEEPLLDGPQFCRLTSERNSAAELWEVMAVKSFEEFKDGFVGVQAEEFTDDFDGKYFAVGQLWQWASSSKGSLWKEFLHKIISFTQDIYDKIIKVHFFALHGQWNNSFVSSSIDQRAFFVSLLG